MKRKKWTEEEEQTLLHSYSSITPTTSSSSKPKQLLVPITRQKRFQPIADRVNSLHHLSDPSSYPFLWSWRDIAIKIHNMRHQYLNVKHKILNTTIADNTSDPNSSSNWDRALDLWPNFLRYKEVFGDVHLDSRRNLNLSADEIDSDELEAKGEHCRKRRKRGWRERLRREESREQEDMEWIERMVAMQMEHEKQAMQMHADACQAQLQILGILVRVLCQFLGPGSAGGNGGVSPGQDVENLRQQQRGELEEVEEEETADGLVGDENGKNDEHSGRGGYL